MLVPCMLHRVQLELNECEEGGRRGERREGERKGKGENKRIEQ